VTPDRLVRPVERMHVDAEGVLAHGLHGAGRREDEGEQAGEPPGVLERSTLERPLHPAHLEGRVRGPHDARHLDGDGLAPDVGEGIVLARVLVEGEHVDAGVAPAGAGILRQSEGSAHARRTPRLHPGETPGLQLGDDLAGDVLVEVCAVDGRAGMSRAVGRCAGHGAGLHDGRAGGLSPSSPSPSRRQPPHSHSAGFRVVVRSRRNVVDADDMARVDATCRGPRQGPSPEWAETRIAGLGRAGLFRPAR
jgi:hypothetical protein